MKAVAISPKLRHFTFQIVLLTGNSLFTIIGLSSP